MARTSAARLGHRTGKWTVALCAVGATGAFVILLSLIIARPKNNTLTARSDTLAEPPGQLAPIESQDPLPPLPEAQLGSARGYNAAGKLTNYTGINPFLPQAEQSIDDRSGMTYPCVYAPGNGSVCQRQLSETEAKERGY